MDEKQRDIYEALEMVAKSLKTIRKSVSLLEDEANLLSEELDHLERMVRRINGNEQKND